MGWTKLLLQSDIEKAMKYTHSNAEAARYCNVSYPTYKKYASSYYDEEGISLFDKHKNQSGKGIHKRFWNYHQKKYPLEEILEGKFPNYPLQKLKNRLIDAGILIPKCELCGFDEPRLTDLKVPVLLAFKSEDKSDYRLENLELLCYNCYHNTVGNIVGQNKEEKLINL